jgi:hypothetical protein|tara:strand:+ start:1019 stop:1468 length:450 start_codon:yes stop_codon:yes gene_type:complete
MMKSFDIILTECLKNKGLKYIRFKVDPTLNSGFEKSEAYEGFVLQELSHENCGPVGPGLPPLLKVLLPGGPLPGIFNVKEPVLTPSKPNSIKMFKKYIAKKLRDKISKKEFEQIRNTNNIDDIEHYLKQGGVDDSELLKIYKTLLRHAT